MNNNEVNNSSGTTESPVENSADNEIDEEATNNFNRAWVDYVDNADDNWDLDDFNNQFHFNSSIWNTSSIYPPRRRRRLNNNHPIYSLNYPTIFNLNANPRSLPIHTYTPPEVQIQNGNGSYNIFDSFWNRLERNIRTELNSTMALMENGNLERVLNSSLQADSQLTVDNNIELKNVSIKYATVPEEIRNTHKSCIICTDEFNSNDDVQFLSCKHVFHHNCLNTWVKRKQDCPCCRTSIPVKGISNVQEQTTESTPGNPQENTTENTTENTQSRIVNLEFTATINIDQNGNSNTNINVDMIDPETNETLYSHTEPLEVPASGPVAIHDQEISDTEVNDVEDF